MTRSLAVTGMRIAHLIESDGPGGAERFLAHMASALQSAGAANVAILPAGGEGWLERELQGSGVAIEHFRLDRPASPACARWLEATFRRHRIDVAHSHEFTMAVYGGWACWRTGIPQVVTMHGSLYFAERMRRRVALRAALALRGAHGGGVRDPGPAPARGPVDARIPGHHHPERSTVPGAPRADAAAKSWVSPRGTRFSSPSATCTR